MVPLTLCLQLCSGNHSILLPDNLALNMSTLWYVLSRWIVVGTECQNGLRVDSPEQSRPATDEALIKPISWGPLRMRVYNPTGHSLLPRIFYAPPISCSMESRHVISLPLWWCSCSCRLKLVPLHHTVHWDDIRNVSSWFPMGICFTAPYRKCKWTTWRNLPEIIRSFRDNRYSLPEFASLPIDVWSLMNS